MSDRSPTLTITRNLPRIDHHGEIVESVESDTIRFRLPFKCELMGEEPWQDGSGKVFSGPIVMGFADTGMYCRAMRRWERASFR